MGALRYIVLISRQTEENERRFVGLGYRAFRVVNLFQDTLGLERLEKRGQPIDGY
jgi:hypothetical protein